MNTELKKLLHKGFIFIIPIIAWICIVVTIDPFNYFNLTKTISQQSKEKSAQKLNSLLYNSLQFKNHPTTTVIIGDSRIRRLPTERIKELTGDDYYILHSNAAKLNPMTKSLLFILFLEKSNEYPDPIIWQTLLF